MSTHWGCGASDKHCRSSSNRTSLPLLPNLTEFSFFLSLSSQMQLLKIKQFCLGHTTSLWGNSFAQHKCNWKQTHCFQEVFYHEVFYVACFSLFCLLSGLSMAGGLEKKAKLTNSESCRKPLGQILNGYKLSLYHFQAQENRLYQIKVLFVF